MRDGRRGMRGRRAALTAGLFLACVFLRTGLGAVCVPAGMLPLAEESADGNLIADSLREWVEKLEEPAPAQRPRPGQGCR